MLMIDTNKPRGIWTGGENNRFLCTFLTPFLHEPIEGLSVGMVIVPPNTYGGLHEHDKAQEIWYVVEGKGKIQIGDEVRDIAPGCLVYGPKQVRHQIINDQAEGDLKALLILCPGGDEKNIVDNLEDRGMAYGEDSYNR